MQAAPAPAPAPPPAAAGGKTQQGQVHVGDDESPVLQWVVVALKNRYTKSAGAPRPLGGADQRRNR
eukprot:COSAG06_NODE_9935_length_1785_cov_2.353290_1_plen_65_part_10